MSLVGNLEDLGLGDILQIVSLSRKSGVLSLQGRGREGKVFFLKGQVVRANSSVLEENLGDLLLRKALIDLETLKCALLVQKSRPQPVRLGAVLAEKFGVPAQAVEELIREQIEKIVYSFFSWTEGTFAFEQGAPEDWATTSFDPLQFMLEKGLNPQWLAMEGCRLLDELRHCEKADRGLAPKSSVDLPGMPGAEMSAPIVGPGAASAVLDRPPIFLVDDDPFFREALDEVLALRGWEVRPIADADDLFAALQAEMDTGGSPALLIDLAMSPPDGDGTLGVIELLCQVRERFPHLAVLTMADHLTEEVEQRVRGCGLSAPLAKPQNNEAAEEARQKAYEEFAETVAKLLVRPAGPTPASPSPLYDIGADLLREMGEDGLDFRQEKGPESPGLHLLKGLLQELHNPSLGGGIVLLVLRFASELMNRAVFFLVKKEEIVGLGQFGIDLPNGQADTRVRRMKIPRDEESVFNAVLKKRHPLKTRLGMGEWDAYLNRQLGGGGAQEVFLGPIVSEGKVVAVVYGDNLPEREPIGDTESLEIFLSQAGLAMDKALLERRLRKREVV